MARNAKGHNLAGRLNGMKPVVKLENRPPQGAVEVLLADPALEGPVLLACSPLAITSNIDGRYSAAVFARQRHHVQIAMRNEPFSGFCHGLISPSADLIQAVGSPFLAPAQIHPS